MQIEQEINAIIQEVLVISQSINTSRTIGAQVLQNVESISAFVEETASESDEISTSTDRQQHSITNVVAKTRALEQLAILLNDSAKQFKM